MQAFHKAWDQAKQFDQDIFRNIACLTGEIGEELADWLAYVIKLANYTELDLHEAYVNKMKRNLTREWHPKIR